MSTKKTLLDYTEQVKPTLSTTSVSMEVKPDEQVLPQMNLGVTLTRGHQHDQEDQQTISDKELEAMSTDTKINDLTEYGEFMPTEPSIGIITDTPQVSPVAEQIVETQDSKEAIKGTKTK